MKTTKFLMMFVAAVAMMFASCGKDDNTTTTTNNGGGNNGGGDQGLPTSLRYTTWKYEVGSSGQNGYYIVEVSFSQYSGTIKRRGIQNNDFVDELNTYGSVTYSNGSGTIEMLDGVTDANLGTATFSISGTTMTLNLLGQTYTLTKYGSK